MEQDRFDACMARICKGDKEALKEIYQEYMKYVLGIIYQVVKNPEDAEDITADFYIKLWTNADKYVKGNSHKAYLATIARNMAIDYIRKNRKEILVDEFVCDDSDEDISEDGAKESLVEQEVIEDISLKEALDRLKPREREVVHMKVINELTFKEISEVMNAPMGTVTWLYRQAINKLRRCGYE